MCSVSFNTLASWDGPWVQITRLQSGLARVVTPRLTSPGCQGHHVLHHRLRLLQEWHRILVMLREMHGHEPPDPSQHERASLVDAPESSHARARQPMLREPTWDVRVLFIPESEDVHQVRELRYGQLEALCLVQHSVFGDGLQHALSMRTFACRSGQGSRLRRDGAPSPAESCWMMTVWAAPTFSSIVTILRLWLRGDTEFG